MTRNIKIALFPNKKFTLSAVGLIYRTYLFYDSISGTEITKGKILIVTFDFSLARSS